jgi:hypothetical protein
VALAPDIEYAIECLLDLGVLSESGLVKLAALFRGLEAFTGVAPGKTNPPAGKERRTRRSSAEVRGDEQEEAERAVSTRAMEKTHQVLPPPDSQAAAIERLAEYVARHKDAANRRLPQQCPPPGALSRSLSSEPAEISATAEEDPTPRRRAPSGSFQPTKLELQTLRDGGMTVREIAELKGVSVATVNKKLSEFGLTVPRRGARST